MKVTVRVPATTANFGPCFDCLGMALPLYNEVTIEETIMPGTGIEINVLSEEDEIDKNLSIPTDENNIVYKAVELLYNSIGQTPSELKITIKSDIPIARGLGSSASVIVGGIIAANELLGRPADTDAILSIASVVEGHPDNIAPAVLGGFVLSSLENDGSIVCSKIDWPKEWKIMACIPDYELATNISRSVLPNEVSLKDAAFNLKRSAMLIDAVNKKDEKLMKIALQDRLHQPYRKKLVPGMVDIFEKFKNEEDVIGCFLSGAGPSVIIVYKGENESRINQTVRSIWDSFNVEVEIKNLTIEEKGAEIIQ